MDNCKLDLHGTPYELKTVVGTEGEKAIDITSLRKDTGFITLDSGYANTGSCESEIGALYLGLTIPRVFCWGTESLSRQARDFLDRHGLEQRRFEGAGHPVMIDCADEFYPLLHDFASAVVAT